MRRPRLIHRGQEAVYHCISRVVGGQFLLGDREKEYFRQSMRKRAEFCGVLIITFCALSNHIHVIVKVPAHIELTDEQIYKRLVGLYGPKDSRPNEFKKAMDDPDPTCLEALRAQYLARMGDLSVFMKELKESFTKWYNDLHERFGTLWAERFKSLLVPNIWEVILWVAAYVDLNPVRAGLVKDPKDYRFCGYAEALARDGPAREGLASFLPGEDWEEKSALYRQVLYSKGQFARKEGQACVDPEEAIRVVNAGGKLTPAELLRLKVRYFTEGIALGTANFVNEVFQTHWKQHCTTRVQAGYDMEGADWKDLQTLRKIKNPVEMPKRDAGVQSSPSPSA